LFFLSLFLDSYRVLRDLHSFPTRRSSDLNITLSVSLTTITTIMSLIMTPFNFAFWGGLYAKHSPLLVPITIDPIEMFRTVFLIRSGEHTSELQSRENLVCRLLLEKKKLKN